MYIFEDKSMKFMGTVAVVDDTPQMSCMWQCDFG
jgi:hypothetical protein